MIGPIHSNFVIDTLSQPAFAREFFTVLLAPEIAGLLRLETIEVVPGSFIDESLRATQSDLLFSACRTDGGEQKIYLLLEHKSHPDAQLLHQLRGYINRILDRQIAEGADLSPVLPVVLYHGQRRWELPGRFSESFQMSPAARLALKSFLLDFGYVFLDVGLLDFSSLRASLVFRAFLRILVTIQDFQEDAAVAAYFTEFRELFFETDNLQFLKKVLEYIYRAQEIEPARLGKLVAKYVSLEKEEAAMTTAERLIQEGLEKGKLEGKLEGKIEVARNLIQAGLELAFVEKATGLTTPELRSAGLLPPDAPKK